MLKHLFRLGFLYPEFRYATPPPSYSISMQQYRQQVVQHGAADGDRSILGNSSISSLDNLSSLPASPPPTYRSRIVGRVRPPLSGVMPLSGATSAELPPPYQNSSLASSLDRLADVEEYEAPGTSEPVLATPDISESIISDERLVSDPSSQPQKGGVVVELLETPTTQTINEATVPISASVPLVPEGAPEALPSVRSIVQRFEYLAKVKRTSDLSEETGQSTSANVHLFNSSSLSGAIESTNLAADQNFHDEDQLRIQQASFKSSPVDQSHSRNNKGDDELCSVNQSLKTSSSNNQSHVTISVEGSRSSAQSSNVHSDNDQSHLRISISDVDSHSINLLPDNPSTDNQVSQARSKSTTSIVCQSQPTSFNNVINNARAASQSRSEAVNVACVSDQSQDSRHIQILPASNHFQVSSSSNPSYRDFSRSQSLGDHEIGESGI